MLVDRPCVFFRFLRSDFSDGEPGFPRGREAVRRFILILGVVFIYLQFEIKFNNRANFVTMRFWNVVK